MARLQEVLITVSGKKTSEFYEANSNFEFESFDRNRVQSTPLYYVYISNENTTKTWKAIRFMPNRNHSRNSNFTLDANSLINSGFSTPIPKKLVSYFDPKYGVPNRYSLFPGAIQIRSNYLIHAGPKNLHEKGWANTGSIEIIGNFDEFKNDIKLLSHSNKEHTNDAIIELVRKQKLYVQVDFATIPNSPKNCSYEY